jgi:plastocyanin
VVLLALWVGAAGASVQNGAVKGRVASADGKGVSDAIVFVQDVPPDTVPPPPSEPAVMDQVNKQFVPNVLPLQVGSKVLFPNHDQIHHHVYSFSRTKKFELPLYKGEDVEPVVFDKLGYVRVGCNIHDWMSGHILVVPSPYFTRTDANGEFVLNGVPPGKFSVAVWHERSGEKVPETAQQVEIGAAGAHVSFTVSLKEERARPANHGVRSYE